jgi:hypothetical protein
VRANLFVLNGHGAGAPDPTDAIGASVDTVGGYLHDLGARERDGGRSVGANYGIATPRRHRGLHGVDYV